MFYTYYSEFSISYRLMAKHHNYSHNLFQDHNTDFIVKFPDWDPEPNHKSNTPKRNRMQMILDLDVKRRFLLQESNSELPQAHLWYSTQEVINALKLLVDAGPNFPGSLTFR